MLAEVWPYALIVALSTAGAFLIVGLPPKAQPPCPCYCDNPFVFLQTYCNQVQGEFYQDTKGNFYCGVGPKTAPRAR